jgi:flagellar assembly protein FliH
VVVAEMSSSDKSSFSASELESLSPWELPEISVGGAAGRSEPVPMNEDLAPVLTVKEIDAMQKQAYQEAAVQGKEAGKKAGYKAGFDEGYDEGLKKGYDENQQLLKQQADKLATIMDLMSEPLQALDERVEKQLVSLAMGVAAQLVRRDIKAEPGQVVAAVREAVAILPVAAQSITLHLHPEDAELVRSALALDEMSPSWNIVDEPLITRGGCKVDTEVSHVDATVEKRLSAVIAKVLGGERLGDEQ